MSRLPTPGGDDGDWGDILNDFLSQSLNSDGSIKSSSLAASGAELTANKAVANGYASLNSSTQVPTAQLGSGTANTTTYLRGDGNWEVPPGSGGSTTLAGDTDVSITSPTNGQVLTYNSGSSLWNNVALPTAPVTSVAGRTGAITLAESDVTNLTTDLSAKVAKGGDTMTGKLVVPTFQVTGGAPSSGEVLTADSSGNATWGTAPSGGAQALAPTAVKTSAYSAVAGDFVPVDASGGSVTITLPSAPADKTRVGVKMVVVSGSNTTTIAAGGSDVFNKAGGSISLTLSLLNQGMLLQYTASTGIWYVQSDDLALAGLDGRYVQTSGTGLPSSVVTSSVDALGNVSSTMTPDLSQGRVFTVTATGNLTINLPINPPSGSNAIYADVLVTQDATGGRTISLSGLAWLGGTPVFNTAPAALNLINLFSPNGGTNWYGIGPKVGPTGPTGPAGPGSVPILMPISAGGNPVPTGTATIGTANLAVFLRALVPQTGTLSKIAIATGATVNGNTMVGVFDTGDAVSGSYTLLWSSASIAIGSVGSWINMGNPALSVTAGQQLLLAIMNSGTTANYGRVGLATSGSVLTQLPSTFLTVPGGASPKVMGQFQYGSLAFSTITEAQLAATALSEFLIIGNIT